MMTMAMQRATDDDDDGNATGDGGIRQ